MGRKKQIVLVVDPIVKDSLDALRICVGDSRARVTEMAIIGQGIGALETEYAAGLKRVRALAKRAGVTWREYAIAYSKAFERMPYGADLDTLEQDDSAVRAHL